MAKFETVKRATIGNLVKADATGFDEWIVGRITASDTKKGTISYAPADGSEEITVKRSEVYKATQAEHDAQSGQLSLNMDAAKLDDVLNTAANVALGRSTGKAPERPTEAVEYSEAISAAEESVEGEEDGKEEPSSGIEHAPRRVHTSINGRKWTSDGSELTQGELDEEEDGKEEPLSRIKKYVKNYETVLASSGKKSKDSGDRVAVELRGLTLDAVYSVVATALALQGDDLVAKYCHLNEGQQRMCLGNRLRGLYRRLEAEEEAEAEAAMLLAAANK